MVCSISNVDNKRKLTDNNLYYYANMSDLELEDFVDSESEYYEPTDNSSEDSSENETVQA